MSVRVCVFPAVAPGSRLRQAARATFFLVSATMALAGCTASSVLAPVPPVDIGTHTAAISHSRQSGSGISTASGEFRPANPQGEPDMVWQKGPSGVTDVVSTTDTSMQPEEGSGREAGYPHAADNVAASRPAPSNAPNYEVPSPAPDDQGPLADRPARTIEGPRYAMLPPANPGGVGPSPTFTPPAPEPEEMPRATPEPAPPAARDLSRPAVMPADEVNRRRELKRLGVRYVDLPPIHERGVCGIDYPVKVLGLSGGIELKPAAILNTNMAVTFAKYVRKDFAPAVRVRYFSGIRTIYTGSTYACRNMIGESTKHLSEHAKGNAIDVMKIKLDSGRLVDVTKPGFFSFRQRGFLKRVRAEACDYFTTVLGPGYNRAHANHFHFDLKQRRNGYVACR